MSTSADIGSLTYELLKKVRAEQQEMLLELGDIKHRLTAVEEAGSSMSVRIAQVEVSMTGTNKRLDRVGDRLERIERRLELREADDDDAR